MTRALGAADEREPSGRTSSASMQSSPEPAALPGPGDLIAGKYEVVRKIGEGGMAVVYEAIHLRLEQRLAIKVLRPNVPDFHEVLARFEREARATAQLRSIHTARVVDVDTLPNGLPYIVMEFLEGMDLEVLLEQSGPLPVEQVADLVMQMAEVMTEAHALGIVHRDLKPANLFVCRVGERWLVKVLDFGISKIESDRGARLTHSDSYFGTPCYTAPEQLRDAASADVRSDVWSAGIILYELLTGRPPFLGTATAVIAKVMTDPVAWPLELRPDLPREVARVVMQALQRDPAQRFQTMRELSDALAPFGPRERAASLAEEVQRSRGKLGEILVADRLVSPAELERALEEQRRSGKLLGRVLLDMKLVSRVDLLAALARQQGIATWTPPTRQTTAPPVRHMLPFATRRGPVRRWLLIAIALAIALPLSVFAALRGGAPQHALRLQTIWMLHR